MLGGGGERPGYAAGLRDRGFAPELWQTGGPGDREAALAIRDRQGWLAESVAFLWWRNPTSRRNVADELVKLAGYAALYGLNPWNCALPPTSRPHPSHPAASGCADYNKAWGRICSMLLTHAFCFHKWSDARPHHGYSAPTV
ncbi:MAG: hypothetical protein HXY39_03375 [Chloroflexi bacterium]|nr:hypothetical protein [Chloroflexota bacterium]